MEIKKGFYTGCFIYNVNVDVWTNADIAQHERDDDYYPDTFEGVYFGMKKSDIVEDIKTKYFTDDVVKIDIEITSMRIGNYLSDIYFTQIKK